MDRLQMMKNIAVKSVICVIIFFKVNYTNNEVTVKPAVQNFHIWKNVCYIQAKWVHTMLIKPITASDCISQYTVSCRVQHSHTGCLTVNCVTFLDFPNVIGPNGSNSDGETSHFAEVVWRSKQFIHRSTAATVGYWDKSWWTDGPSKNMFLGRLTVKTYLCLPALSVCLSGRIQTTSGVAAPLQGWVEVCGGVDVVLL